MANNQIISDIKRKGSGGNFDTYHLGPEQKYVGSLLTSNDNNLEEQILMGTDKVVTTSHDDEKNMDIKRIEFRRENDDTDYYTLEINQYQGVQNDDLYVKGSSVVFITENVTVPAGTTQLEELDYNANYNVTDQTLSITPNILAEKDSLYYTKDGQTTKISEKEITHSFNGNVVTTKEKITNYI